MTPEQALSVYKHTFHNADRLIDQDDYGCCNCERQFKGREIQVVTDSGKTLICPDCGIDAILHKKTAFQELNINDKDVPFKPILIDMWERFFQYK